MCSPVSSAFYSVLPGRLRLLRCLHDMSQERLAERIGATREAVSLWETGRKPTSMFYLLKLAAVFDVPLTIFFPSLEQWHPAPPESAASFAISRSCHDPVEQDSLRERAVGE
jgi:transcriptional regulator with XRE-family HTH domain